MRSPRALRASLVVLGLAPAAAIACGEVTIEPTAGPDASIPSDAKPVEAAMDALPPPFDATPSDAAPGRCSGATYTTAPSGAACDPTRIERAGSFEPPCYGPGVGTFCDRLQVSVSTADEAKLEADGGGWVCGSAELGVKTCTWSFGDDAAAHAIDDAALEAACAATEALPAGTKVICAVHGS